MTSDHDRMRQVADGYAAVWNSGSADAVAAFTPPTGGPSSTGVNHGRVGAGVAEMAAGFFADVPDLSHVCDGLRIAGDHVGFLWTFTGSHAATRNSLRVSGWEEWDMGAEQRVTSSRGWFDADDYALSDRYRLIVDPAGPPATTLGSGLFLPGPIPTFERELVPLFAARHAGRLDRNMRFPRRQSLEAQ